ncbi:MAG: hypothetical protein U0W24_06885 [Bacteroidales bacterium]
MEKETHMKNSINRTIFIFIIFGVAHLSYSQQPEQILKVFFEKYSNEHIDSAFKYIFNTNKYLTEGNEQVTKMKIELKEVVGKMDSFVGIELITKKTLGESIVLYSYMLKYKRQPIRFIFTFYNNGNWVLHNFTYDLNVIDELEESVKLYFLKEVMDQ